VTKPFSLAFKQKMVERLTGKDAVSAQQLAQTMGLKQQTLSRWLQEARSLPVMPISKKGKHRSVEEKARVVIEASRLTGEQLTDYLEREGVSFAVLEQWRLSLDEAAPKATMKRIRDLERELARKEKALAEAAALLILKKKVEQMSEDADDGTKEETEK
jgi:transposase